MQWTRSGTPGRGNRTSSERDGCALNLIHQRGFWECKCAVRKRDWRLRFPLVFIADPYQQAERTAEPAALAAWRRFPAEEAEHLWQLAERSFQLVKEHIGLAYGWQLLDLQMLCRTIPTPVFVSGIQFLVRERLRTCIGRLRFPLADNFGKSAFSVHVKDLDVATRTSGDASVLAAAAARSRTHVPTLIASGRPAQLLDTNKYRQAPPNGQSWGVNSFQRCFGATRCRPRTTIQAERSFQREEFACWSGIRRPPPPCRMARRSHITIVSTIEEEEGSQDPELTSSCANLVLGRHSSTMHLSSTPLPAILHRCIRREDGVGGEVGRIAASVRALSFLLSDEERRWIRGATREEREGAPFAGAMQAHRLVEPA